MSKISKKLVKIRVLLININFSEIRRAEFIEEVRIRSQDMKSGYEIRI
jgi:hypothetical protein